MKRPKKKNARYWLFNSLTYMSKEVDIDELVEISGYSRDTLYSQMSKSDGEVYLRRVGLYLFKEKNRARFKALHSEHPRPGEKWVRYNDIYECSNYGRFRKAENKRICYPYLDKGKGLYVKLSLKGTAVARAIYRTFVDPDLPVSDKIVHLDLNHWNNHIDNLESKTKEELGSMAGKMRSVEVDKIGPGGEIVESYTSIQEAAKMNFMGKTTMTRYIEFKRVSEDGYIYVKAKGA